MVRLLSLSYLRLANHKSHSKNPEKQNRPLYKHIDECGGWGGMKMILIESYPCNNKDELRAREHFWIDKLQPSLNKNAAYLSDEEKEEYGKRWRGEHKEYMTEYNKRWREENREYRLEYNKRWREEQYQKNKTGRYHCDICDISFVSGHSLQRHLKNLKHENKANPSDSLIILKLE